VPVDCGGKDALNGGVGATLKTAPKGAVFCHRYAVTDA
jgi:hypothetical protein